MRKLLTGLLCAWLTVGVFLSLTWADQWQAHDFFNLTGGLNDSDDPTAIKPNEASDLQNIVFVTGGAIVKRSGYTTLNTSAVCSPGNVTGLTFFKLSSGTRFLVAVVDCGATDNIYSMPYGAGTAGPTGTWTSRTGALSFNVGADNLADFAAAQDQLVIEDGLNTTPPMVWTGTGNATALGGSPGNQTMVEYHKRIMWAAGNDTNPSTLYFSNLGDIATWTSTDTINIETNDGQVIRALKSALDCLYIFKDESIWRTCGTNRDDFTTEQMVRGIGTLSNQSVQVINNIFYFVSSQGEIVQYDGGITYNILSSKIKGTTNLLNKNRMTVVPSAQFINPGTGFNDYYAAFSTSASGTNDRVIVYDTYNHAFTKFVGMNVNAFTPESYELGSQQKALGFGDYGGVTYRYPNGNSDNTAAISAYYQSGWLRFDVPFEKTFRLIQMFANQTGNFTMLLGYAIDFDSTTTSNTISLNGTGAIWDTAVWDNASWGDLTTTTGRVELLRTGDFIQFRPSDNSTNPAFTVKGLRVWVEPTQRIGGIP